MICTLLELENRPIPLAPTHCVLIDVLNKDLSIKRVTIYYNPLDSWGIEYPIFYDMERNVGKMIGENLKFVGQDTNSVAFRYWVIEINTQKVILKPCIRTFEKC